ncbi:MAG: ferritin-like domain-containing protein [Deltaproteobacteria bacterium]|nr:ferritin-like domain-containing protein [Deltaproteobacteria bacterium]
MPDAVPTGSDAVRNEWLRRVEAEYRSATITQHLTLWLMQVAASPDLLHAGLRIAEDELVHAELSMDTYLAAGGTGGPTLARESLGLRRREGDPLEWDVLRVGVDVFCLGETVAVPLFKHLREGCTVKVARRALDRILRDEVRHRDFGWTLLGWMLTDTPHGDALRALIDRELPTWFRRIRASYGVGAGSTRATPDEDRAWGLMAPAEYARVLERTFERDWLPRFRKLGIDPERAWTAPA